MYKQHFLLEEKPFSLTPDPEFLYFSTKHRTAYALLEYGLIEQMAGLSVISGEVGAGKTTLIRQLLKSIDQTELSIGLINNTHESLGDLLQWVSLAFDITTEGKEKVTLFKDIQKYLIDQYAQGKRTILIIDEAQNLDMSALEELRMLTNINSDQDQLLQIVLVGQPQLLEKLSHPDLAQIAQRVSVEYHLEPLNAQETIEYVRHRVQVAGGNPEIFSANAVEVIYYFTGGVPRLINTLCEYALVHGYAAGKNRIDMDVALEVVKGRKIGGVNRFKKNANEVAKVREMLEKTTGVDIEQVVNG